MSSVFLKFEEHFLPLPALQVPSERLRRPEQSQSITLLWFAQQHWNCERDVTNVLCEPKNPVTAYQPNVHLTRTAPAAWQSGSRYDGVPFLRVQETIYCSREMEVTSSAHQTGIQKLSERTRIIIPNFKILPQLVVTSEAVGFLCTSRSLYFIKRNLLQHFGQELQEIINKFLTSKRFFLKS